MKPYRWIITGAVLLVGIFCSYAANKSSKGQQFLWQTNSYGDDVHIIDVVTHKVVGHIKVGPQPHGIAAPDDAHVVFVAIENFKGPLGELVWVDPKTYKVTHRLTIGPKPNQIACTPDGRWVYVPCNDQHYWVQGESQGGRRNSIRQFSAPSSIGSRQ